VIHVQLMILKNAKLNKSHYYNKKVKAEN